VAGGRSAARSGRFSRRRCGHDVPPFRSRSVAHITPRSRTSRWFRGPPSYAALAPWDGASALTACMETFRLIDGQRPLRETVRVHGHHRGGQGPNIIPERASWVSSPCARPATRAERVGAAVDRCPERPPLLRT
jgi:metal-dependent amidase/aminoacylase/carboxypeptidase family protein